MNIDNAPANYPSLFQNTTSTIHNNILEKGHATARRHSTFSNSDCFKQLTIVEKAAIFKSETSFEKQLTALKESPEILDQTLIAEAPKICSTLKFWDRGDHCKTTSFLELWLHNHASQIQADFKNLEPKLQGKLLLAVPNDMFRPLLKSLSYEARFILINQQTDDPQTAFARKFNRLSPLVNGAIDKEAFNNYNTRLLGHVLDKFSSHELELQKKLLITAPSKQMKELYLSIPQEEQEARFQLFKSLDPGQKKQLIQSIYGKTLASEMLPQNLSPNFQFLHRLFKDSAPLKWLQGGSTLKEELAYSYTFDKDSLNNDCTEEKKFDVNSCLATTITEAKIDCEEKFETSHINLFNLLTYPHLPQFNKDLAAECTLTIKSDELKDGQASKVYSFSDNQTISDAMSNTFPLINGASLASAADLSFDKLKEAVSGSAQFNATLSIKADKLALASRAFFNPIEKNNPHTFSKEKKLQLDDLTVTLNALYYHTKEEHASELQASYTGESGWQQVFSHRIDYQQPKTEFAFSSKISMNCWKEMLETFGILFHTKDKTLILGLEEPTIEQPPHTEQEKEKSWSDYIPNINLPFSRAAEIATTILLPAALGAGLAYKSGKFCYTVVKHPKKTLSQKASGLVVGSLGIIAGLGVMYERLSQLNLKSSSQ